MLLLFILIVLQYLLPCDIVLLSLIILSLFPVMAGSALSLYDWLFFNPDAKAPLASRIQAARQLGQFDMITNQETAWYNDRMSKTRPWAKLPQWDATVICESGARGRLVGAASGKPSRRTALRSAAMHPDRY